MCVIGSDDTNESGGCCNPHRDQIPIYVRVIHDSQRNDSQSELVQPSDTQEVKT